MNSEIYPEVLIKSHHASQYRSLPAKLCSATLAVQKNRTTNTVFSEGILTYQFESFSLLVKKPLDY
jgi:hypothetical protein